MAWARSSAHRSATSAITTMVDASRLGSVHTVQGFCVSILPQVLQISIFSIAVCSAAASGAMTSSRFLIRNKAARRAERGPSPGRRASNWIRRSISGPAETAGIRAALSSEQFQAGRQRQAAGHGLHFFGEHGLELAPCIGMRGDDQVFEDFLLVRLEQRIVE